MTNIEIKKRLRIKAAVFQTLVHSFIFFDIKLTNATVCTLCSDKTPTHIFFHISMNYLWI